MNTKSSKGFTPSNNSANGRIATKQHLTGFTLIEIIVSISLFSFILVIILGFFGYAIKGQQKALASQEISDQISYAIEYIGRSIRMSKRDASGTCVAAGTNYSNPYGNNSIRFLNYEGFCQEFYLENEQLKRKKSSDATAGNLGSAVDLTSSKLKINSAKFNIIGDAIGDNTQPRITLFLDVEKKDTKQEFNATVKIQTTISERNLDI